MTSPALTLAVPLAPLSRAPLLAPLLAPPVFLLLVVLFLLPLVLFLLPSLLLLLLLALCDCCYSSYCYSRYQL